MASCQVCTDFIVTCFPSSWWLCLNFHLFHVPFFGGTSNTNLLIGSVFSPCQDLIRLNIQPVKRNIIERFPFVLTAESEWRELCSCVKTGATKHFNCVWVRGKQALTGYFWDVSTAVKSMMCWRFTAWVAHISWVIITGEPMNETGNHMYPKMVMTNLNKNWIYCIK